MDFQIFAKRLKQARENAKLTQTQFSEKTGIAQGTISAYEQGKAKNPTIDSLIRMANILDVSIDWLVGASDEVQTELEMSGEAFLRRIIYSTVYPSVPFDDGTEISKTTLLRILDCKTHPFNICALNINIALPHEAGNELYLAMDALGKVVEALRASKVDEEVFHAATDGLISKIVKDYGKFFDLPEVQKNGSNSKTD